MAERNLGFGVVVLMCLGIFVCMIDTTIMNIALPAIQSDLHTQLATMSWVLNVYTMSIAVLSIPLARTAEVFGKAKFFILGLLLFAIGSALCGVATGGNALIAARFMQSVGASVLMPVSMIIGVSAVSVQKRHFALAILGSTQGLAAALGPAVGGIVTQTLGWEWVFYVNVPICLVAAIVGWVKLGIRGETRSRVNLDIPGVVLSSLAIFAATLVLVQGNEWGWGSHRTVACCIGSLVALFAFILVERKVRNPMVNLALFRNAQFSGATLAMTAATVYMVGVTVLLPQFLTHFQGKTELQAALLVTPVSATIFFVAPVSGTLARKIGNFLPVFVGFVLQGLSYLLLKQLSVDAPTAQLILICVLLGAGFGFVVGPASTASAADFEGELLTASQSVTQMFRQVGVVLSVAIFVSGLTHFLSVQKQDVLHYATSRVAQMDVPASVKSTVLAETKTRIMSSDWSAGDGNGTSNQRVAKTGQSATRQTDEPVARIQNQVSQFSIDMSRHANSSMALSFSKLYQTGIPAVFGTTVLSFLFLKRQRKRQRVREVSHRSAV